MGNILYDEENARLNVALFQFMTWPFAFRIMLLAKQDWQEVHSYQKLSSHPSLPLNVQESQHMMLIAVCLIREGSSRTAAKAPQAYRHCILHVTIMYLAIEFAHNTVVARCRC